MARELRLDFVAPVEKPKALTDGSIRVPAYLARVGVQVYQYSDGSTVREYRPPEEVFSPKSMETWPGLALTVLHPTVPVDSSNWKSLSVGHVADNARKDGGYLASDVVVKDADAIAKLESGELRELSAGYFVDVDPTPGVTPEGEPYDCVQRNIIGNHIALGPEGWGRAGPDVRLYSGDSAATQRTAVAYLSSDGKGVDPVTLKQDANPANPSRKDSEQAQTPATVPLAEYEKVCAERDALKSQVAAANEATAKAGEAADSKFAERVRLRVIASKLDSSIDPVQSALDKGKTDREVMVQAITKARPGFKADGKSDEYVRASFDIELERSEAGEARSDAGQAQPKSKVAEIAANAGREDAADAGADPVEAARKKMLERNAQAWKGGK